MDLRTSKCVVQFRVHSFLCPFCHKRRHDNRKEIKGQIDKKTNKQTNKQTLGYLEKSKTQWLNTVIVFINSNILSYVEFGVEIVVKKWLKLFSMALTGIDQFGSYRK